MNENEINKAIEADDRLQADQRAKGITKTYVDMRDYHRKK